MMPKRDSGFMPIVRAMSRSIRSCDSLISLLRAAGSGSPGRIGTSLGMGFNNGMAVPGGPNRPGNIEYRRVAQSDGSFLCASRAVDVIRLASRALGIAAPRAKLHRFGRLLFLATHLLRLLDLSPAPIEGIERRAELISLLCHDLLDDVLKVDDVEGLLSPRVDDVLEIVLLLKLSIVPFFGRLAGPLRGDQMRLQVVHDVELESFGLVPGHHLDWACLLEQVLRPQHSLVGVVADVREDVEARELVVDDSVPLLGLAPNFLGVPGTDRFPELLLGKSVRGDLLHQLHQSSADVVADQMNASTGADQSHGTSEQR